tara:strand:+ start:593 stop:1216 length:624 start_codon:yes stop_codon:yes gene_type:complete
MSIEIKKSKNPINYTYAINKLEKKVKKIINQKDENELIWFLEHKSIYTAGSSYKNKDIINKKIKIIRTKRGGRVTWHGPGQLVCYFVLDLKKRKKDIRKFIKIIEYSIIKTLSEYDIKSFSDRKNIGIWHKYKNKNKKIAAIGLRVRNWIVYHGFSINISNDLLPYKKIFPCGLKKSDINNLIKIKNQKYKNFSKVLEKNLINNLKI